MKKTGFTLFVTLFLSLLLAGVADCEAARLGGGKSFGSRPSYSTPYNRSAGGYQSSPAQQPAYQQPGMAAQRNQAARDAMSRRGGLMGMLGGLALGGLLGAMFFGGAFEHINFMDILIFAGLAYLLFKLFAARSQGSLGQPSAAGGRAYGDDREPAGYQPAYRRGVDSQASGVEGRAGFNTDVLFRGKGGAAYSPANASNSLVLPADFDAPAFLRGAKAAYAHLQESWDRADLGELRGLCTDKVFAELQDQLRQRQGENHTELLQVEAELLEVKDVGGDREAAVLFDVLLREAPGQQPVQIRELWHFVRSRASKQPTWFLDGIQQVED